MNGFIDRFQGDYAIVELAGGEIINIAKYLLPEEAKEGDMIGVVNGKYVLAVY